MSPEALGVTGVIALLVIMFLGIPIGVTMILIGGVGIFILTNGQTTLTGFLSSFTSVAGDYTFAILPVFMIMSELADMSGMMADGYDAARVWLARIPGGLAMASVAGAAGFSCVSGSSTACTAIMSRVAIPQLLRYKYDPRLATGAVAAGGTLGNIIPPGGVLVVYAMMTSVSLGKLFIACYIPGFLLTFMYMVQIFIQVKLNPALGPLAESPTWKERLFVLRKTVAILIVFLMVFGGIQLGVFTPNEAASIATVFVFFYALARRTMHGQNLLQAFKYTASSTGMIIAILVGARFFGVFMSVSGVSQALAEWVAAFNLSSLGVLILIMILYYILAFPLDAMSLLLVTLPVLLPVIKANNIDLIWFGVLAITQCELGNLTPPVGMCLFVVGGMVKPFGISMSAVFRGAMPFVLTGLVFLILLIAFPQISLFLVTQMK
jgi:C4-dicarboxylate transporter, DctM subunit